MENLRKQARSLAPRFLLVLFTGILGLGCLSSSASRTEPFPRAVYAATAQGIPPASARRPGTLRKAGAAWMVQSLARQYLQALLDQQYGVMWSLLHPQMQTKWPNEQAFARFWQTRFQEYTLQDFTLGHVQALPFWVDPETMIQYTQVEALPVSLQLAPKAAALQAAQLPPEDAHPGQLFHNLPLIVQYTGDYGNQHWYILDGGPADLEAPILPPIRPVTRTVQVPILMYHHITPYTSTDPLSDYTPPWVVPPTRFSQQMDYLKLHGYHSITLNQLFDALYYGGPLPPKPIVLTFDDGDADHYQFAYPILLTHHFSGMFYIITGQVGWASRVSWSQLREMLAHGMQIGSHTVHHVDLTRWLSISEEVVQQELQQSQRTLETQLGIIVQQFCYPYGDPFNRGTLWQRQTIATLLATDGYVGAATAFGMTGSIQQSWNPLALLRIPVFGVESFQGFMASLPWV